MQIKVQGIGGYTKAFKADESKESNYGYVNRAFSDSGKSKSSKAWGAGFISISPRFGIYPDEGDFDEYFLSEKINKYLVNQYFAGEMRTTKNGQRFLALYDKIGKEEINPDQVRYLLKVEENSVNYNEVKRIVDTSGLVLSEAVSTDNEGYRMDYEALLIIEDGGKIKMSDTSLYTVSNGELLK